MFLLALLALACAGSAVAALLRVATANRARLAARVDSLGSYGYTAGVPVGDAAVQVGGSPISGVTTMIGAWVAQRIGAAREAEIRRLLVAAGFYSVSVRTLLGYRLVAAVLLPVPGLILAQTPLADLVAVVVLAACGWTFPMTFLRRRVAARAVEIEREIPNLIDQLVVTLEAGVGFSASLHIAAERMHGALGQELRLTLQEQRMGTALTDSLYHLRDRVDSQNLKSFVRAVVQGERLGVSIGNVMRELAVDMRKRRRQMAEEQAQKTPVKLLLPLVFLILPVMFIVVLIPPVLDIVHGVGR
jgi:tight adherence protein C